MGRRTFPYLAGVGVALLAVLGCSKTAEELSTSDSVSTWVKPAGGHRGIPVGQFKQEVRTVYHPGPLGDDYFSIVILENGEVYAGSAQGLACFKDGKWAPAKEFTGKSVRALAVRGSTVWVACENALFRLEQEQVQRVAELPAGRTSDLAVDGDTYIASGRGLFRLERDKFVPETALNTLLGERAGVNQIAVGSNGLLAVAAVAGLFLRNAGQWQELVPEEKGRRWALSDVRGAAFDVQGRLWAAGPQGVACAEGLPAEPKWRMYAGADGLPYDDFTVMAPGEDGVVWFGTTLGAIRFDGQHWAYRQGPRWLPNDKVRDIAVTSEGHAWFATAEGIGFIERGPMSLAQKAKFYEDEIDRRHRRTPYGFVDWVKLKNPGDTSQWEQRDSDNDGGWTGMYGAGECFAYAATKDPKAKERAKAAFDALCFLRTVTQGGEHPAPPGFVARTVLPGDGPDPNEGQLEHDKNKQKTEDALWRVYEPRWPKSADGKWYWKSDTSSDELDAHYFFYALYYDLVAETDAEKAPVQEQVRSLTDHLIEHDFQLVDHAGVTRWARYGPELLNHDSQWWSERGLNSLSMLSYLKVAAHITGDAKYAKAARMLIEDHGYAINALYPKAQIGPGSGNQADDKMAFMNYYNLLKYEDDPKLRQVYTLSLRNYFVLEEPELNPLFNFICMASIDGDSYTDAFGARDLSPKGEWLENAVDTLKRWPLDLVDWKLTNSRRIDLIKLPPYARDGDSTEGLGCRPNGKVLPVDERFVEHWDHDPWELDEGGEGRELADGSSFLLPYYMGLYHGFIKE